jgi:hypothetical protein
MFTLLGIDAVIWTTRWEWPGSIDWAIETTTVEPVLDPPDRSLILIPPKLRPLFVQPAVEGCSWEHVRQGERGNDGLVD